MKFKSQNDPIGYVNSLNFPDTLTIQHIPAELHMFAHSGHDYGIRTKKDDRLRIARTVRTLTQINPYIACAHQMKMKPEKPKTLDFWTSICKALHA